MTQIYHLHQTIYSLGIYKILYIRLGKDRPIRPASYKLLVRYDFLSVLLGDEKMKSLFTQRIIYDNLD